MAAHNWMLRVIVLLLLLAGNYSVAQAAGPQKIAILPVINHAEVSDPRVLSSIERILHARFHTPLSSFVPVYTLIPADEVSDAAREVYKGKAGDFSPNAGSLSQLAGRLNADIVLAAKLNQFRQDRLTDFEGDQKTRSYVAIAVYFYERQSGQFIMVHDEREYLGDELPFGDPLYLTNEVMNALVAKLPIRSFAASD